jgi:hypothetical protein
MPGASIPEIPPDIYKFIQQEQGKVKERRGNSQFSIGQTIVKMLKDYKKCREQNNFKPSEE